MAKALNDDLHSTNLNKPKSRRILGDTSLHNIAATPAPKRVSQTNKEKERVKALQRESTGNRRTISAPARLANITADVTGMTGLLDTPAKGREYGTLGKNGEVGGDFGSESFCGSLV
jgi:hypothetical protein